MKGSAAEGGAVSDSAEVCLVNGATAGGPIRVVYQLAEAVPRQSVVPEVADRDQPSRADLRHPPYC